LIDRLDAEHMIAQYLNISNSNLPKNLQATFSAIFTAKDGRFLEMLNFQKFGILTDSAWITCGMI